MIHLGAAAPGTPAIQTTSDTNTTNKETTAPETTSSLLSALSGQELYLAAGAAAVLGLLLILKRKK